MIVGKNSALKGFALLLLVVSAVLVLIATILTKITILVIAGVFILAFDGFVACLLYKKWSDESDETIN